MLNLSDIGSRVNRGIATADDIRVLFKEVSRLYGVSNPELVIAQEAAAAAQSAADTAAKRAADSAKAATADATRLAQLAAEAKAVADAARKVAADKAAADKAVSDKVASDAIVAQKNAVATSLKTQLAGAPTNAKT